jgi:hypothetical protein
MQKAKRKKEKLRHNETMERREKSEDATQTPSLRILRTPQNKKDTK